MHVFSFSSCFLKLLLLLFTVRCYLCLCVVLFV
jgi:hypothetical protein